MAFIAQGTPTSPIAGAPRFPQGGRLVTPHDTDTYQFPIQVRANTAGTVVGSPFNGDPDITLTLAVGEFFPCELRAVKATGTTGGIVLHAFY